MRPRSRACPAVILSFAWALAAAAALAAGSDDEATLRARLGAGVADPGAEAIQAARAGRFRFVWSDGFGFSGLLGLTCNGPLETASANRAPYELAARFYSDTPGDCTPMSTACVYAEKLEVYGSAYNRTLADQPQFPFPDVCRPSTPADRPSPFNQDTFKRYAEPVRVVTSPPHDLHEAARRGRPIEVKHWPRRSDINGFDMFGFTPLSWAVVRDRPEAVKVLLANGADPLASPSGGVTPRSALWLGYPPGRRSRFAGCCARTSILRRELAGLNLSRPPSMGAMRSYWPSCSSVRPRTTPCPTPSKPR